VHFCTRRTLSLESILRRLRSEYLLLCSYTDPLSLTRASFGKGAGSSVVPLGAQRCSVSFSLLDYPPTEFRRRRRRDRKSRVEGKTCCVRRRSQRCSEELKRWCNKRKAIFFLLSFSSIVETVSTITTTLTSKEECTLSRNYFLFGRSFCHERRREE